MLSKIKISNLKCFDEIELTLKNFNLLVGMNSSGKSTLIQALLLAVQNISNQGRSPLNGSLISLGNFSDARNFITNAKEIVIEITGSNDERIAITISEDGNEVLSKITTNGEGDLLNYLDFSNKHIKYISSNRIGSQDLYENNYDNFNDIGVLGEYAIDYYNKNKSVVLEDSLIKDKTIGQTLESQVNYWLKYILNSELSTEDISGTDRVKAQYKYLENRSVRPKNIGTGLSYVIAILISALSSEKGDINIIENPEIHLHPRAQSKISEFLSFVANAGITFLIETHSDHIFNGLRKTVKRNTISNRNITTYFFKLDEEKLLSIPHSIEFDESGNVINHQKGLFDQFDDDLDELLGLI